MLVLPHVDGMGKVHSPLNAHPREIRKQPQIETPKLKWSKDPGLVLLQKESDGNCQCYQRNVIMGLSENREPTSTMFLI